MIFNENRVESDLKQHVPDVDIDTFHIKIIKFSIGITKRTKKFLLAAAWDPGSHLERRAVSGGPLCGN